MQISNIEWYPFNIMRKSNDGDIVLHIISNNKWSEKLYDKTLNILQQKADLDWEIRLDGPYGESSKSILNSQHAILVGAGHGISRMAPILQDIALRLKNDSNDILLKRIDLHWIIEDQAYFEWFTKLLQDIKDDSGFFNYHIYFVEKTAENFNERLMYISTNTIDKSANISLLDNFWDISTFGLPNWSDRFKKNRKKNSELNCCVFYSGPQKYKKKIKKSCSALQIPFKNNMF